MRIHKSSSIVNVPGSLVASYSYRARGFCTKSVLSEIWKSGFSYKVKTSKVLRNRDFVGNIPLKIFQRTDLTVQVDRSSKAMVKTISVTS